MATTAIKKATRGNVWLRMSIDGPSGSGNSRRGDAVALPIKLAEAHAQRFWNKVRETESPSDCWNWLDVPGPNGYGMFSIGHSQRFLAHRVAYTLKYGEELTSSQIVMHTCDNRRCCNPSHLVVGTDADNAHDRMAKGRPQGKRLHPERYPRGEKMSNAKLTAAQVREIRGRYANGGISSRQLAREYGIAKCTVLRIVHLEIWKVA